MAVDLIELTNTDRRFYTLLGPFLANREVVRAVGGPIWDDDKKTWLVAVDGGEVAGFVAVAARGSRTVVESLYVRPGKKRVAATLVKTAVDRFGGAGLYATVAHEQVPTYTAAGFKPVDETANFTRMHRSAP